VTRLPLPVRVAVLAAPLSLLLGMHQPPRAPGLVPVRVETSLGAIDLEIDSARAPITATNFLRYVDAGAYTNGRFHRTVTPANQPRDTVRIEVVQAGPNPQREGGRFPAIPLERTSVTGLRHEDGVVSMARGGPNSATSDFFIVIGAQPSLDEGGHRNLDGQGFAAFGRVVRGMDVVKRIQQSPAEGQSLTPPVLIVRMARQ
jgi:peptidyl-prolyl cis-trans isomerase A (cyclophilin A)